MTEQLTQLNQIRKQLNITWDDISNSFRILTNRTDLNSIFVENVCCGKEQPEQMGITWKFFLKAMIHASENNWKTA